MSNQRLNNAVYVKIEIYDIEPCRINVVYFNVDVNNVRQRQNNVAISKVEFHNVDQYQNSIVNMTIFKKLKRAKKKMTYLINNACFQL